MGNKEDWEDVKKIDTERKRQEISKYGLDFSNININKEKISRTGMSSVFLQKLNLYYKKADTLMLYAFFSLY